MVGHDAIDQASKGVWEQSLRFAIKDEKERKMGVTEWEGVIVGYPAASVGYRVWDPVRGNVYNVGVPHVDELAQSSAR